MNQILEGLPGVVSHDILIFGQNQEDHDDRLKSVLERLQQAGVTSNAEKCAFSQRSLKFLGHLIDEHGIRANLDKITAIRDMDTPKSITDLRRFMGMVNQSSPKITDLSQPLQACLSTRGEEGAYST